MLCPHCKTYTDPGAIVCPSCGKLLPRDGQTEEGVMAIRQGRPSQASTDDVDPIQRQGASRSYTDPAVSHARNGAVYADPMVFDANGEPLSSISMNRPAHATYGETASPNLRQPPKLRKDRYPITHRSINWARVLLFSILGCVVMLIGVFVFLMNTDSGQRIMARMGFSATSAALWEIGTERIDVGDIDGGIAYFERAAEQDGEENVNVAGLLELGAAYESAGRLEDAEALYTTIYTDIVPSAMDAYTNVIRIMLAQERNAEAADLMQLAYTMTGSTTFQTQRANFVPAAPTTSKAGGYYEENITVELQSEQGYDVYYTFDENAILPDEGILFTSPLLLDEKTWRLRAVCVSGELISDELSVSYTVSMPSPSTPYANLAPNTYAKRRQVQLWVSIDQKTDENIMIFYTIDGSIPDADSPVYDGTPIWLPAGRVTLRAVSVNQYGKASNMLERTYKFTVKPEPLTAYSSTNDVVNGITLNLTTYNDFISAHGEANSTEEAPRDDLEGTCTKYLYDWGYAVFHKNKGTHVLVELYFTNDHFNAPRSTGIGSTMDTVVSKFRDMGQVESPSGNRGLYETSDGSTGYIYLQEDGGHIIRYCAITPDYHTWQLEYTCTPSGVVSAVDMKYIP